VNILSFSLHDHCLSCNHWIHHIIMGHLFMHLLCGVCCHRSFAYLHCITDLINSWAQHGIIAWGRAASCHVQPISVVLNHPCHDMLKHKINFSLTKFLSPFIKCKKFSNRKIYTTLKWANSCRRPRAFVCLLTTRRSLLFTFSWLVTLFSVLPKQC